MRETSNDSTCKIFTFRNIYRCKSTSSSKRDLVAHVVLQKKILYLERLLRGLLDLR